MRCFFPSIQTNFLRQHFCGLCLQVLFLQLAGRKGVAPSFLRGLILPFGYFGKRNQLRRSLTSPRAPRRLQKQAALLFASNQLRFTADASPLPLSEITPANKSNLSLPDRNSFQRNRTLVCSCLQLDRATKPTLPQNPNFACPLLFSTQADACLFFPAT